ncbi:MAG: OmpH family outer membrane protein [Phycisphaerales bacterium]|nr:OmpH family outer membrane protein [Phycisphaerales bacterium]
MVRFKLLAAATLVTLGLAGALALSAAAGHLMASPTAVATVQLDKVMNALALRAAAEAELRIQGEQLDKERERRAQAIKDFDERIANEVDPARKKQLVDDKALQAIEFQWWLEFAKQQIDVERALRFKSLYSEIRKEIRLFAGVQGYDLVLVDDSDGEPDWDDSLKIAREVQIRQDILKRRVLYAADNVDITEQIIIRMNNAFNAKGGG